MFTLTDTAINESWGYDTEAQLKAATRLYAMANPRHTLSVTINGRTSVVYVGR
jgi:hypothetical protein